MNSFEESEVWKECKSSKKILPQRRTKRSAKELKGQKCHTVLKHFVFLNEGKKSKIRNLIFTFM